ncbi:succinylglutamate desuccinylase/aspartoacylase family protein [Chitinophaga sp.]|uniref:succinylglutamate desuccinylase/aspartoacylase family protein n=1 Tax=Chitinophaga sp. TaxID=1869181 RepID=UPI0031CE00B8
MKELTKIITASRKGPKVLVMAGVHGDEYEPVVAALELADALPSLLTAGSVQLLTLASAGAYEAVSRFGADGLDMARRCPGAADGSSTDQAAYAASALIRAADYLIDMHTGGLTYDIFPLAGYMLHPVQEILQQQQQMALAANLPLVWGTDFRPDGRTLSVARDHGIPAIYLEYGGGTGFRREVAEAYRQGVTNILRHLGMISGHAVVQPAAERYWVEDHRTDSGFLQGKMPAPAEGIFIADVKTGNIVAAGSRWGVIIDPYTGSSTPVYTDAGGLVFLLRTMVKVKKGDALGGVLPISQPGKIVI